MDLFVPFYMYLLSPFAIILSVKNKYLTLSLMEAHKEISHRNFQCEITVSSFNHEHKSNPPLGLLVQPTHHFEQ